MEHYIEGRVILGLLCLIHLFAGYALKVPWGHLNKKVLNGFFITELVAVTAYIIYDNLQTPPYNGWTLAIIGYLFVYALILMTWAGYSTYTEPERNVTDKMTPQAEKPQSQLSAPVNNAVSAPTEKTASDTPKQKAKPKATQKKPAQKIKIGNEFDLLCVVGSQKVRLPFQKRGLGTPIGIFPFKNKPEYLELDEVENKKHTDSDVDESRLLDERFCCGRVSKITDRLNAYLKELNKPLLEGSYLADSSYMPGCGWIIGFDNTGDYHGGNVPAKLRYMGRFYGKCKE